jgi:iron complex transport system permease protein
VLARLFSPSTERTGCRPWQLIGGLLTLVVAIVVAAFIGPADLPFHGVLTALLSKVPLLGVHSTLSKQGTAVIWQIRMPRIVLGGLVGAMLAVAGATYQGVFQNPLADPYLLGVAAGAGLGATLAVELIPNGSNWPISPVPIAAFVGGIMAAGVTFVLGRSGGRYRSGATLVLAGVAVAAFFTAIQTYAQQRSTQTLQQTYSWILGGLTTASWQQVEIILPYLGVSCLVLVMYRRILDVMSVGDEEADSLGIRAHRVRLVTVIFATLGTAAAVSMSGLIGFVGIIIPHTLRLIVGSSYRRIVPLSLLFGAAMLIFADLLARTIASPAEIPLGVITAFFGAPFFLVVLRRSGRSS